METLTDPSLMSKKEYRSFLNRLIDWCEGSLEAVEEELREELGEDV